MEPIRPKILVSACLVGCCCRYDAVNLKAVDELLGLWMERGLVLPFCPETAGGLPTPRPRAEISGGTGGDVLAGDAKVLTCLGEDVTENFVTGAQRALSAARLFDIRVAVLKEGSPACGTTRIYDGSFQGRRLPGQGVAAACLAGNRVTLFNEANLAGLEKRLLKVI